MLKVLTYNQVTVKFPDFEDRNGNDYGLEPKSCIFFYYPNANNVLHIKCVEDDDRGGIRYYTFTQGNDEAWTWHHSIN